MSVKSSSVKVFKTNKISSFSLISQSSGGLDQTEGPEDWEIKENEPLAEGPAECRIGAGEIGNC